MSNTKHQIRHNIDNMTVTLKGVLKGIEYGGVFNLLTGTVEGLKDTAWKEPPKDLFAKKKDKPEKGENCPGCARGIIKLLRGGMGWAKAALRIDAAPPEIAAERQSICESCTANCYDFGVCRDDWPDRPRNKQGCGCILALKVTQNKEECPHKLWLSHNA